MSSAPTFFATAAAFRRWLAQHHARHSELVVGFFRKDTGRGGITYAEALDEALCYGWIDGIKRRYDSVSYTYRFTPRRPRSNWSAVNLRHYARLHAAGRVAPPGQAAFAAWDGTPAPNSFERRSVRLSPAYRETLQSHASAWRFFQRQPPGYRRTAEFWVMSAKQEPTRLRRLETLIAHSARHEPIPPLIRTPVKRRAGAHPAPPLAR